MAIATRTGNTVKDNARQLFLPFAYERGTTLRNDTRHTTANSCAVRPNTATSHSESRATKLE